MKRLLDCTASDFRTMNKEELLASIAGSEGRVLACESIGYIQPMLGNVTNAEFTAAMGADILLLNMFDVQKPVIQGLPKCEPMEVVARLKALTGRPIGINLEPVDQPLEQEEGDLWAMTDGRKATLENARRAADMGVNFILLTGNPGVGVTNEAIVRTLKEYKAELGDRLILAAGKMHASGILTEGPSTSSPPPTWMPLPRRGRISSFCPPPAPCPASPWSMSEAWSPTPTPWAA